MTRRDRWLRRLERLLLLGGGTLALVATLAFALQVGLSTWDAAAFERERARAQGTPGADGAAAAAAPPGAEGLSAPPPDTSDWSASRIARYAESLLDGPAERLARLEIPSLDLSVVVLDGTDAWTLNRGVGRIEGTAPPGSPGNLGIAGHRDGFFRPLRHLEPGDPVRLVTRDGVRRYRVDWIRVVDPEDVWVLEETRAPSLTLVTCYPFYYVGHAPRRYVVRARAEAASLPMAARD